jgi:hypothetical protein
MFTKIFSAIVAILVSAVVCSAQSVLYFPQFVDGGSFGSGFWGSVIAVSNPAAVGSAAVNGTVTLTKPDGTALNLQFYDENGAPIPNTFVLGGGQTKLFYSPILGGNLSPFNNGFATVSSNLPVAAGLVFLEANSSGTVISQAGVPGTTPLMKQATVAVRNNSVSGSEDTGVAIANPGTAAATVTFQLLDKSGALIVPAINKNLGASNQIALFISELFPNAPTTFTGTMRITSDQPVAVVSLLILQPGGLLSTIPVFPVQ